MCRSPKHCILILAVVVAVLGMFLSAWADTNHDLTDAERQWLKENAGRLRLYFDWKFPPLEYLAPDGSFAGLGAAIIREIEERIGVQFEKQVSTSWTSHVQSLERGETALCPVIVETEERKAFAYFTPPYAQAPVVVITERSFPEVWGLEDFSGRRVGVVAGYAIHKYVQETGAGRFDVIDVANVQEGLRAVASGQLDALVENLAVALHYIETERLSQLRVACTTPLSYPFCIAVSKKYPELFDIVSKAYASIPAEVLETHRRQAFGLDKAPLLSERTRYILITVLLFLGLLTVGLTGISMLLKRRLAQSLVQLQSNEEVLTKQLTRVQRQQEALSKIALLPGAADGNMEAFSRELAALVARAMDADLVSIWIHTPSDLKYRCASRFELPKNEYASGMIMDEELARQRAELLDAAKYAANANMESAPGASDALRKEARANQMVATVDAAIRASGMLAGFLCVGHCGGPRNWHQDELDFACQAADQIALAIVNRERRLAERALHESESRYRELVESANSIILRMDRNGHITYINAFAQRFFGYAASEILGMNVVGTIVPETDQAGRDLRAMILDIGAYPERYAANENENACRDGRRAWISWTNRALLSASGEVEEVLCIGNDISELKQAEARIQRDALRLQALVNILQFHAETVQSFLDNALSEAIRITDSQFGYLYFYDEEAKQFILNSWSKDVMAECAVVNPQTCYELDKTGIWGEAVRQRRTIILNDFAAENPLKKGYPPGHVPLMRFMTLPVFKEGRIVAVVGMANKPTDYDEADQLHLSLMMDVVWKSMEAKRADLEMLAAAERVRRQRAVIAAMAIEIASPQPDENAILKNLAFTLCEAMETARASIWRLNDDRTEMVCLCLFDREQNTYNAGAILQTTAIPRYFEAILTESRICADDVQNDPRTSELTEAYLAPLGITSMLDAGIGGEGGLAGVVCLEHIGPQRRWHADEEAFISTAAAMVAQLFSNQERREAEKARRQSESLSQAVMDQTYAMVGLLDVSGRLVRSNQTALDFIGVSFEAVQNQHFWETPWWPNDEAARAFLQDAVSRAAQGETVRKEVTHLDVRGKEHIVAFSLKPLLDASGTVQYLIPEGRDITDIRRAEQTIVENEAMFRSIFENAPYAITINRASDGAYMDVNQAFLDSLGITREQALNMKSSDLPMAAPGVREMVEQELLAHGVVRNCQTAVVRPDGSTDYVIFSASALMLRGEPCILSMVVDISELKRTEEALREREETFRALAENSQDVIMRFDRELRHIYVNPAAEKSTGIPPEQFLGKTHEELGFPEDLCWLLGDALRQVFREGHLHRIEFQLPDGVWIDWLLMPEFDEYKQVKAVVSSARDITERKRAEEALRESEARVRAKLDAVLSPEGDLGALHLSDIVDAAVMREIMGNFSALTGISVAIIDLEGEVLAAGGWQDICTQFHRVHPDSCRNCIESDTILTEGVEPGAFKLYRCKNNMWDIATPIIVGGKHLGNLFLGQFLQEDETPQYEIFRQQARQYGYDETAYLAALDRVPRLSPDTVDLVMRFYTRLANLISTLSFSTLQLARTLEERKRDEQEIRNLRNYLANIIDSMPSVLVGVDPDGRITQWNQEATRHTGINKENALGCSLEAVFPRLSREMDKIRETVATRQTHHENRVSYHHVSGESRYEDITVFPLIANGVEGAVIRLDDITERVRLEEMMVQSEKMLSVGGLAAGMAHEINNPLGGMIQTASVLEERLLKSLDANQRVADELGVSLDALHAYLEARNIPRMLHTIRESGSRAASIVRNMLSFARKSDAERVACDLAALLDQTLELATTDYDLKKKYDFKAIDVVREYARNMPTAPCNPQKIQQVVLNLLKNAADAMYEGKQQGRISEASRITVRTRQEGVWAIIEVEDNGPGMDRAVSSRVFEPFYTTKSVDRGTGLGLSISYFIVVENHGGKISVDSEPGKGARFTVQLPIEMPETQA